MYRNIKKHFSIGLLAAFLCFAHTIYSQNSHKAFNFDRTKYQSIETSEGLQISKMDGRSEGEDNIVIYKEIKNQPSATKNNHPFTLHIEGKWLSLVIGNGDDFYDFVPDPSFLQDNTYKTFLPEGYYDIVIAGVSADNNLAYVCYDQLLIDKDTELAADIKDAIHKIEITPVDDNNNPINEMEVDKLNHCYLFMHPSMTTYFLAYTGPCLYVSDMGDRNKLFVAIGGYDRSNNNAYFIAMPMIENGVTEDILFKNNSEDVVHYSQMFNTSEEITKDSYSHYALWLIFYDFETEMHFWMNYALHFSRWIHDRTKPYSLYTNLRYNDTPQTGDVNVFISPLFFETFNPETDDFLNKTIEPFPMAINKNGELMIDFFSYLPPFAQTPKDLFKTICNNPISRVYSKEEYYHEGYRTPHLYHQAINFTAETNPWGAFPILFNHLLFIGEFGEKKHIHAHVRMTLKGDGITMFNGDIFTFNKYNYLNVNRSQYQIELINDQVFAYGRKMINHTIIDFDLTKPDANPPTLTMLRVIDDERISMSVAHASTARLEITAGDITVEPVWMVIYDKKPNIAVSWSSDGETFYDLPAEEDASKFHPGYGYFFNVSLAPLSELGMNNAWITVKIILTDDAGNSQVQILDPLFHYGSSIGIDEILSDQANNVAYPNPFTGNVNIELKKPVSGEVYFEIYDISGRIIHQQKTNCDRTTSFTWNGSHLKEGMYFYGVYSKEDVVRGKIIKN
jgi:hypothetical protein